MGLVILGLVWSIVNGLGGLGRGNGPSIPVVHGPVETHVETLGGVRVRPVLHPGARATGPTQVTITFHNAGAVARLISPADVRLVVAGRWLLSGGAGTQALHTTVVQPGAFVTGALRFAHPLAPGATIVYAPAWAHGHALRWLLWH